MTQQEYEETKVYEENGGTTTCIIHHYANGSTTESCEWVGPWEEYWYNSFVTDLVTEIDKIDACKSGLVE